MEGNLKKYIELDIKLRDLDAQTKQVKSEMSKLHDAVLTHMQETDTQRVTSSGITVHINRRVFASAVDIEALQSHELTAPLVKSTCNSQTLSSWVNELEKDDQMMPVIPDELKDAIKISETFKLGTRVAS